MKWNPSSPTLECVHKQNGGTCIHVSQTQAECLSKTNSGTVQDQNQGSVECGAEARAFEICAERQEMKDVLFGKKIRNERGFGRQTRPDRFSYAPRPGGPVQIAVELSENCGVA
jgi:hypothetical protein